MLMEQKSACDSMIDEKNKLIHDFQQVNKFQYLHVSSGFFSTILHRKINTVYPELCYLLNYLERLDRYLNLF